MFDRKPVEFTVIPADDPTEIFLIDGNFRLLDRGVGKKTFTAPPGIYKIKARAGKAVTETLYEVHPGMTPIELPLMDIVSAMPLAHTARTHEFHFPVARDAALAPPSFQRGSGSAIVIAARIWTSPQPSDRGLSPPHPAKGLTLRDLEGEIIVNVENLPSVSPSFDPCVAVHVGLSPGPYRLTLTLESGRRVEQVLIACRNWQTHIYVTGDNAAEIRQVRPDLVNASITMRRPGEQLDRNDPLLRLEEIAREALINDRRILSKSLRLQIAAPACPPMLALLGARLLVRESKHAIARREETGDNSIPLVDNRESVRTIVRNLRESIGPHPDVEALALGADIADQTFVFATPPHFLESWRAALKASAERPDLIPAGSFAARIAGRVWGEGPWLLWLDPDSRDQVDYERMWQAKAEAVLQSIEVSKSASVEPEEPRAWSGIPIPEVLLPTGVFETGARIDVLSILRYLLKILVRWIRSFFVSRSRTPFPDLREQVRRTMAERKVVSPSALRNELTENDWRSLIKTVGVPMSSINRWLDERQE